VHWSGADEDASGFAADGKLNVVAAILRAIFISNFDRLPVLSCDERG
jgi:hypothetical protein